MSQDYNPSLVTKNLVFCGDAAMKSAAGPAALLYDKVNDNNGTMYNGTVVQLDGGDEYLDCGVIDYSSYTGLSVCAWINGSGLSAAQTFVSNWGPSGTSDYAWLLFISQWVYNTPDFLVSTNGTGYSRLAATSTLASGQWHHLVGTWESGSMKLYLNGVLDASGSGPASIYNPAYKTAVGADFDGGTPRRPFDGMMADIRVYDKVLSLANVKEIYDDSKVIIPTKNDGSGGFIGQSNLKIWLPLMEGAGTIGYDGSGNGNNGIGTNFDAGSGANADWLTGQTGCPQLVEGYNRPMFFDGSNDVVENTSVSFPTGTQSRTIAGWVWLDDATSSGGVFGYGTGLSTPYQVFEFYNYGTSIRLHYATYNSGGSTALSSKTWYHLAGTYDGTTAKVYINGALNHTDTVTLATVSSFARFGCHNYSASPGGFVKGNINEVVFYNTALSLAQVQALAATGPNGGPLPPDAAGIEDNASGGTVTTSDGWTTHTFTSSGTFTPSFSTDVEVLVVAGGGGGGTHSGGGGGAGGLLYYGLESPKTPNGSAVSAVSGVSYTITVGAGGDGGYAGTSWAPPYYQNVGVNGVNSSMVGGAISLTAIGGGGGSNSGGGLGGVAGGSGGGGGRIYAGGAGTAGQGYAGSNGFHYGGTVTPQFPGAGGGGAGATGTAGSNADGGDGGVGLQYSISGTATYYAGGGGGNIQGGGGDGGDGGNGGGGAGSAQNNGGGYGFNGTVNTGGGGGGTQYYGTPATGRYGNGGSGIVVIRYRTKSFLEADNIKGYWRNDGNTTWTDLSGNGNTGTVNGSPDALLFKQGYNGRLSTSTGRDNQGFPLLFKNVGAIGFNGSSDQIIPSASLSGPLVSTKGTLDFWINFVDLDSNRGLYYLYDAAYADYLILRGGGSGNLTILAESGNSSILSNNTDLSSYMGQWINLVYTQDGTTIRVYVDGVEIDSVASTVWTGHLSATPAFKIGWSAWSLNYLNGGLGAINVYDRALTQTEITKNFAAKANRFQIPRSIVTDGLVLWLDAGDGSYPGSGTTWYDLSGNNYDATLVGGPTVTSRGVELNGSTQYITLAHGGNLAFSSGDFTISVWCNYNGGTSYGGIITNDYSGDNAWKIFKDASQAYFKARSGSTIVNFPAYTLNTFHCYTYTRTASLLQVYFDGVASYSASSPPSPTSYNDIAFGSYRYADAVNLSYLNNQTIGTTTLYNRALSAGEVAQNFRVQRDRFGV